MPKIKNIIRDLVKEIVKEQVLLQGEAEAMKEIVTWLVNVYPHGVKKEDFFEYIKHNIRTKYGREATMHAYNNLIKGAGPGKLVLKKLSDDREFVVWVKR
jgi:hypothetical protein